MKFIVDFIDSASQDQINQYLNINNCQLLKTYNSFTNCYLVESQNSLPITDIIESVINDNNLSIVPLSYDQESKVNVNLTLEENWWKTVSIERLDFNQENISVPRRGINACVYIIDSGVMSSHPDLIDADITHLYSFNGDVNDYHGHGTAIASVISGNACGMTSAKIKSLKIFQSGVDTYQSHVLEALDTVYNDYRNNTNQFSILNLSWIINKNTYIENKLKQLAYSGITIICSAGNNGQTTENLTPAGMAETITIGSFNRELKPCDFSNYPSIISNTNLSTNLGPIFGWAPGEYIKVASIDGNYNFAAGTSISAGIASASLAYNTWLWATSTGDIPNYLNDRPVTLAQSSMGNNQLLSLPKEYYHKNTSWTVVFQIFDKLDSQISNQLNYVYRVNSGQEFDFRIFDPLLEQSLIEIRNIPDGLYLDGNYIKGKIETDDYFTSIIDLSTKLSDGREVTVNLILYVLSQDYTIDMIPLENNPIKINLQAFIPSDSGCCYFDNEAISCYPQDGICNACTLCGSKGLYYCACGWSQGGYTAETCANEGCF